MHQVSAALFIVTMFSGCSDNQSLIRPAPEAETRRYVVHDIFLSGGSTDEQLKLYEAYQQALEESKASGDVSTFPLVRRTFEIVGTSFPEGTAAVLSPRDSHLWIHHSAEVLDRLEERFSIRPADEISLESNATDATPSAEQDADDQLPARAESEAQ